RSPNSSPSNSSTSGSVTSGSSQHSPGSVTISSNGTIVAGGSLGIVNPSTGPSSHHHVNLNRTPTVIMGEAGGVRTMLWSTPGQPIANSPGLEMGGVCTPGGGSSPGGSSAGSASIPPPVTNGHNGMNNGYLNQNSPPNHMQKGALSMELLWASEALNLSTGSSGSSNTTNGSMTNIMGNGATNGHTADDDDYEQPMICMICEDRATGLHYGIITCEGCKGFFKRTVQNRRVYTCVADGTCEITKAQRNRCQYCRFKKCIEQGMVLQDDQKGMG
ncbi:Hormone receptor 4, partial [Orchesella cincta]